MTILTTFLLVLLIYYIGVLISLIIIAWVNAKFDAYINQEVSFMSWAVVLAFLMSLLVIPLEPFYNWIYNKIKKYYESK